MLSPPWGLGMARGGGPKPLLILTNTTTYFDQKPLLILTNTTTYFDQKANT